MALAEAGVLDKYGVELIGAKIDSIKKAEDRLLFKDAMRKIGLDCRNRNWSRPSTKAWSSPRASAIR